MTDYGVLRVRPAALADAEALAPRLRPADLREIAARSGEAPVEVLRRGVGAGKCYAIESHSGDVVALFGVSPSHEPKLGIVWLLGSEELVRHKTTFLRHSREWLARLAEGYALLGNLVDERNTVHVRWLQWLGFRFLRRIPLGRNGETFIEFVRIP